MAQYYVTADILFREMMMGNVLRVTGDTTIPADSSIYFLIQTGGLDVVIAETHINAFGAELVMEGFAEAEVSAVGTPYTAACTNRSVNKQHQVKVYQGPTVTNDGNEMVHLVAYATTQGQRTTLASIEGGNSYKLAHNTSNLLKLTNRDLSVSCKVSFGMTMYEDDF